MYSDNRVPGGSAVHHCTYIGTERGTVVPRCYIGATLGGTSLRRYITLAVSATRLHSAALLQMRAAGRLSTQHSQPAPNRPRGGGGGHNGAGHVPHGSPGAGGACAVARADIIGPVWGR